ncbi:MAG TPA: GNAT family N-acetyltransferase [Symbiobacteriaceae bacterium]|nr:GNAT family N-acetyltransferase [Symbiobacteriaceae bacterium]
MDLQIRLENHWLACMAAAGGGARVTRMAGGLVVVNATAPGYTFNFTTLRGVQPDRLATALDHGGMLLAEGGRPSAVFLSPAAGDLPGLTAGLAELGWRRLSRQSVLIRDLSVPLSQEMPPNVLVESVTARLLPQWRKTLVDAYEVEPLAGRSLSKAWSTILSAPGDGASARGYLAWVDGVPAGTGLLWSQGGVAGLYCGAVLPARRRSGIHRALLLRRLSDAWQARCALATLQTEAGGPVEQFCVGRLAFSVSHCRDLWVPGETTFIR